MQSVDTWARGNHLDLPEIIGHQPKLAQPLPAYRRQANGGQHMSRFVPSATWHLDK